MTTLIDYVDQYIDFRDASDGYRAQIKYAVSDLERHAGRTLYPWDLSRGLINEYLKATKENLAPRTRRNRRNYFSALLDFAAEDLELQQQPDSSGRLNMVRVSEHVVQAWTIDEVRQLLETARELDGAYGTTKTIMVPKSEYWTAWIMAAWDTAWRGCDLRSLERGWIPSHGRLVIQQTKTGRVVSSQMRRETIEAIDRLHKPNWRLCFPLWCRLDTWRGNAASLVRRAGLRGSIGYLRHAAATAAEIEHPGSGHLLTGHASRVTFLKHYCDQAQISSVPLPPSLSS